ncbi:MAG: AAA family ATPase [Candidatus Pacearchaeota archaeon]
MIIKKIRLKNIRSYEDQEIEFPEGSILLSGDIGSGKTSVLLAIEFALFGLQPGQKGASLLRNGKEEGSVTFEFNVDGKDIIIERSLKRGKSVNQSSASLIIEGEKKSISVTELKNFVLSILNYPPEFAKKTNLLYKFTVYTPQEEMKQIILENPETRLDTLRHIFGIDKYKLIKENTEIVTAKIREQIRESEGAIKDLEEKKKEVEEKKNNLSSLENQLKNNKNILIEKKHSREKIEKEIKEIENKIKEKESYEREIEKTNVMLLSKKEQMKNLLAEKKDLENQINEIKKIKFDEKDFFSLQSKKENYEREEKQKDKERIEILGKINALKSKISEAEKLKEQISSLRMCPTCFQLVAQNYKENVLRKFEEDILLGNKKLSELEKEKEKILVDISSLEKEIFNIDKKLEQFNLIKVRLEALEDKQKRLSYVEKQIISISNDIEMLDKQVDRLKNLTFELKKYENIFNFKNKELQFALNEEKKSEILIATTEKEIELTKKNIEKINNEILEKEKIKSNLLYISELEDWLSKDFSSLISFTEKNVMLKLREEFSKLFCEWFNILVPDTFTTRLDEDFTPIIEQHDFSLDYSFLSGGERTAVALAYRLALNQVINSLLSRIKTKDVVILDEPTDGFSEQQLNKMRDVLNQLNIKQLIMVSHEQQIESFVENIIKFRKENGITKVEYKK